MKNNITVALRAGFVAVMLFAAMAIFASASQARTVSPVEGAAFNVSQSMNDNLKIYTGKNVVIHLRGGKTLQGYVKSVSNHFVHLEKLSERDFYDALIRMEDISAMEARFREMK